MTTDMPGTAAGTDDNVTAQFAAIVAGDTAALQRCFAPGATIWHNFDEVSQDVAAAADVLAFFHASATEIAYKDQRIVAVGNLRFIQHVLTAKLKNGKEMRLPAMMRMELGEDGRVVRMEEYFDSRGTDCLFNPD